MARMGSEAADALRFGRELMRIYCETHESRIPADPLDEAAAARLLQTAGTRPEFPAQESARLRGMWTELAFAPLDWVAEVFGLCEFERFCVLLALLPEVDAAFGRLYGYVQGGRKTLTPWLVFDLWFWEDAGNRTVLAPGSVLLRFFFEPGKDMPTGGLRTSLRLCGEMRSFLLGEKVSTPFSVWGPQDELDPIYPDDRLCHEMLAYLERDMHKRTLFLLYGPAGVGKRLHIRHFARISGQAVLCVDAANCPEDEKAGLTFLDTVERTALLRQCVVCITGLEVLLDADTPRADIAGRLAGTALRIGRVAFATSTLEWRPRSLPAGSGFVPMPFDMPGWAMRGALWRELNRGHAFTPDIDFDELAGKFAFTPGQISGALYFAAEAAAWKGRDVIDTQSLQQGCYSQIDTNMGRRVVKVDTCFKWDDLILPEESKDMLRAACNQVRHRHVVYNQWGFAAKLPYGRGLSMLFSGPPGTGKTMGAQMTAAELGLELYKVDLAAVVSKYIGETEKNLQEIFDGAYKCQSVLFFDEADSLFAKRTEVKDSNDRYGNMESAFLLQKMEEYDGICILATNYVVNFDEAFKRRIKFIIHFPFPDAVYRERLWRSMFPPAVPLGGEIDWAYLACNFELAGGNIKNIAVNAAFIAAAEKTPVGMRTILRALKNEMKKNGKTLTREDLGEYYMLV